MEKLSEQTKLEMKMLEREYESLEQDLLDNEENYSQSMIDAILARMDGIQNVVARLAHGR